MYEQKLNQGALACIVTAFGCQFIAAIFFSDFYYIWTCRSSKDEEKINIASLSSGSL
jgi:hypothetical protein